jgi:hypothetical protein
MLVDDMFDAEQEAGSGEQIVANVVARLIGLM